VIAPGRVAALLANLGGTGPAILARAPGRVNLIGEHTDYNGLPVLPFAIEPDVLVAARPRPGGVVEVGNVAPGFAPRRFRLRVPIPARPTGDWGNYVQAAAQALLGAGTRMPPGARLAVDGRVPVAAGVSSSSALVVAVALALERLGEGPALDPVGLAELLARGEQYVGTLSGGMDQAAILLGREGHAVHLDFFPLRGRPVRVPAGGAFVVAHTLDEAPKSGRVRGLYNQRVVECRLACAVLARRLDRALVRLGDLPDPAAVQAVLPELLPDGAVSRTDLVGRCGLSAETVQRLVPDAVALADPDRFVLRARVRHVLAEALRVGRAERALRAGDLRELGALLDESHASGAADYGTSTAAADALVRVARAAGALGARLMGAGFGGAVFVLAERDRTAKLMEALDRVFYAARGADSSARFVVAPSAGARVARVDCHGALC
jgi:N-acetylgalactosamine kinase